MNIKNKICQIIRSGVFVLAAVFFLVLYLMLSLFMLALIITLIPIAALYYVTVILLQHLKKYWTKFTGWYHTLIIKEKNKGEVYFWLLVIVTLIVLVTGCMYFGGTGQPSEFPVWLPAIM